MHIVDQNSAIQRQAIIKKVQVKLCSTIISPVSIMSREINRTRKQNTTNGKGSTKII